MKTIKKLACVIMCLLLAVGASSCGRKVISEIDVNKKQIYVNAFDGGNGVEWLKKLASDFNVENDDSGYEVVIKEGLKYSTGDINTELKTGTDTAIYFTADPVIKDMISHDYLEDMTDVWAAKPDGEDGLTVEQKFKEPELYRQVFSGKGGEGRYGVPYSDSFMGLVYEHDRFLENNWYFYADGSDASVKAALDAQKITYTVNSKNEIYFESSENEVNYKAGDRILTCGKDGKYGTYDDGQPQTIEEWEILFNKVRSKGGYPLLWAGGVNGYTDDVITAVNAQYDGLDNYKLFSTFDGTYVSPTTGAQTVITPQTGNKIYQVSEGLRKGVEFLDTWFTNTDSYIHPFATYLSTSHREAQAKFLYGFENVGQVYLTAMICEGVWWENEAKPDFNSLVSEKMMPERGYGKKEYRYMLWPYFDNQKGIDGNGHGTVMSVKDSGAVIINKNIKGGNEELKQWAKKFVIYTLKDQSLRYFTKSTGVVRPYKYQLTAEDLAAMTPFQRNVWTMFQDEENIAFVRPFMDYNVSAVNFASGRSKWTYTATYGGASYLTPLDVLKKTDANGYMSAYIATNSDSVWQKYYNTAIAQWGGLN